MPRREIQIIGSLDETGQPVPVTLAHDETTPVTPMPTIDVPSV